MESPKHGFDISIDLDYALDNQDIIVDWLKENVGKCWWDWYSEDSLYKKHFWFKDKRHVLHFKLRFG
jgi:hypothetical protein